jgi:bifunctional UDP-N-acetylglucosamine pyrophosphorylase/glucosamine-1-phosphate N-acetyltransferase
MKAEFAAILAAGGGARMNSSSPAALKRVCGRSLAEWSVRAVLPCCEKPPVVVQGPGREIERALGGIARYATQENPAGTADALRRALESMPDFGGPVLVVHANIPLLQTEYYQALVEAASREGAATLVYSDEDCDCVVSAGAWCFADWAIRKVLDTCPGCESVEQLADALSEMGVCVQALLAEPSCCVAAVDCASLALCEDAMNARILNTHFKNGVTIIDPSSVRIGPDVVIGRDAQVGPSVILSGKTEIGEGSIIKNGCTLSDTKIGRGCELHYVVANETAVGDGVKIGPFVNLRPGTVLADGCKVGDFVEVKNSNIGRGTKLPHLSYIGDADVGERVNVSCGAVFVNYDGFKKHRTKVGNDVFIGCQTNLVAPVTVGDDAYTAAGSTITLDVPAGAMAIARARQVNKEGYVERFRSLKRGE